MLDTALRANERGASPRAAQKNPKEWVKRPSDSPDQGPGGSGVTGGASLHPPPEEVERSRHHAIQAHEWKLARETHRGRRKAEEGEWAAVRGAIGVEGA
jgi:hypothetical protein